MASVRTDILTGHKEAESLHRQMDTRNRYLLSGARIDVFRLAHDLGLPVMFRPLEGLLGVYVKEPAPGILLTTQRPESVQRLTCAHELGHHWLSHQASYDDDIGFALGKTAASAAPNERQADAFAFNLLMPRWLMLESIRQLQQLDLHLPDPLAVYQLSVRVGASYMACALTLSSYKLITPSDLAALLLRQPKDIKIKVIPDVMVPDWHRDVWLLSEADDGAALEARLGDVFVARVREASTAGYSLETSSLVGAGFRVLANRLFNDARSSLDHEVALDSVGSFPLREAIVIAEEGGQRRFELRQKRPWEDNAGVPVVQLDVKIRPPSNGLSELDRSAARKRVACVV